MKFPKRLITQTPECLTEPVGQVLNVIISTLFALVFLTAYVPFSETAWFQVGRGHYFFITAALTEYSPFLQLVTAHRRDTLCHDRLIHLQ